MQGSGSSSSGSCNCIPRHSPFCQNTPVDNSAKALRRVVTSARALALRHCRASDVHVTTSTYPPQQTRAFTMTAKWTSLLRDSLNNSMKENTDSISYALATHAQTPSVRFVVHRGFVNERRCVCYSPPTTHLAGRPRGASDGMSALCWRGIPFAEHLNTLASVANRCCCC